MDWLGDLTVHELLLPVQFFKFLARCSDKFSDIAEDTAVFLAPAWGFFHFVGYWAFVLNFNVIEVEFYNASFFKVRLPVIVLLSGDSLDGAALRVPEYPGLVLLGLVAGPIGLI